MLLTKREGRTGRISARGPRADTLPVRSWASLVNKRFIIRLKKAFKDFHKFYVTYYVENVQDKKDPILRARHVYILRQMKYAVSFVLRTNKT